MVVGAVTDKRKHALGRAVAWAVYLWLEIFWGVVMMILRNQKPGGCRFLRSSSIIVLEEKEGGRGGL